MSSQSDYWLNSPFNAEIDIMTPKIAKYIKFLQAMLEIILICKESNYSA